MSGTRVTCEDVETKQSDSVVIENDYVLITDGQCERTNVQIHNRADGGKTHVITVRYPAPGGDPA